ncbi:MULTISPECIES: hypothetical protein [Brevibacillus]|uniref:Peptidyl-prolyl cis-trans isomerase n=1 Tax=Brevibacillus invocatus TaxID=173959 RepID=A0A3M8CIY1_9BACL|nr:MULTISPECIES: hypothetical protein [Brevibacillus]MCM3080284.1 hypothetical protein [Brevibacillus invocatus]MCM3430463.1 hypothetical protein [Brevibacillus invocatus]MDH4615815.1 hypothetical protein [Brevibacillus sp. AY1]RNB75543.1 hypothetical protein EDM52_08165 [Brevibacillus invocatus]
MSEVIVFKGAVSFPITLDPTVWIFDDRKIDLSTYTGEGDSADSGKAKYLKGTGAQWDKELAEGAQLPSERPTSLVEARKALEGDYGMRLDPFITNAQPLPEATHVRLHRENQEPITLTIAEARNAILQFSRDGKPIRENGPVYFYLPEMLLAKEAPIEGITIIEFVQNPES